MYSTFITLSLLVLYHAMPTSTYLPMSPIGGSGYGAPPPPSRAPPIGRPPIGQNRYGGGPPSLPGPPPPPMRQQPQQVVRGTKVETARGRKARHPRDVRRFAKYFPGPPECGCKYPENPLDLGKKKKVSPKPVITNKPYPVVAPPPPTQQPQQSGNYPPPPPSNVVFAPGYGGGNVFITPVDSIKTVYEKNGYTYDATVGGGQFDHPFNSHAEELFTVDPCPKEINEELELSDGIKKFIFTSKSSNCRNMTWSRALDFCQSAGMQAISLGDDKADEDISAILGKMMDEGYKMGSFWTSGYITRFKKNSLPTVMWASTTMSRTEEVTTGVGFWAADGLGGEAQPDNYAGTRPPAPGEYGKGGRKDEECVAAALDAINAEDGGSSGHNAKKSYSPGLHDVTCEKLKPVVCEERQEIDGAEGLNMYM